MDYLLLFTSQASPKNKEKILEDNKDKHMQTQALQPKDNEIKDIPSYEEPMVNQKIEFWIHLCIRLIIPRLAWADLSLQAVDKFPNSWFS